MSFWKFKTTSGGSVTLAPEDSSTDDVVIVPKGNVTLATTDDAPMAKSPDGSIWEIKVDDSGVITAIKV